jgi:hypothetical protein
MKLLPYIAIWAVCALTVGLLALYRKVLTIHGDDEFIHLSDGEQGMIPQQVALGNKLAVVDRWGKGLTVFTAVFGFVILAQVLYQAWEASLVIK